MKIRVETVDWLLFNYPEFATRARTLEANSKGIVEFMPRKSRPSSPVERVVLDRDIVSQVVEAIEAAVESLEEEQRKILFTKYGWHYDNGKIVLTEPIRTKQVFQVLNERGEYYWSIQKFYNDLATVRSRVAGYVEALGKAAWQTFSSRVGDRTPTIRHLTDEEYAKVVNHLRKRGVRLENIEQI